MVSPGVEDLLAHPACLRSPRMRRLSCLVPALSLSCAGADGKGGEEDDPSTEPLALLLVWDRSASMAEEAFALAQAVPALNAGLVTSNYVTC